MLIFDKIIIQDFAPYKNRQTVDISGSGVSIVWGNNGVGKTSLLNAIRYALYGEVYGRSKKKYTLDKIPNKETALEKGTYNFSVSLHFRNDQDCYELSRSVALRKNISSPKSERDFEEDFNLKKNNSILGLGEKEHELNRIMPKDVSRFFLFDGELLQEYESLLSSEEDIGRKIKESIEKILGVPVLTNSNVDVGSLDREYQDKLTKVSTRNGKTALLGNRLGELTEQERKHKDDIIEFKNMLKIQRDERISIEETLRQNESAAAMLAEKRIYIREKEKQEQLINDKKVYLKTIMIDAWKGMIQEKITKVLDEIQPRLELLVEKKKKEIISFQILDQITSAAHIGMCPTCNQSLSPEIREKFRKNISEEKQQWKLSDDESQEYAQLIVRSERLKSLGIQNKILEIETIESDISTAKVSLDDAINNIDRLQEQMQNIVEESIDQAIKDHEIILSKIGNTEDAIRKEENDLAEKRIEIAGINKKLLKQTSDEKVAIISKQQDFCSKIAMLFEETTEIYRQELKKKVEKDATDIFLKISSQKDYIGLSINENYGLSIVNKTKDIVEIRSAGFEHITALSLIGALHKNAPLRAPIIMDSPFGRLDLQHKSNIISVLPYLSDQVLLLVFNGEIDSQLAREKLGNHLKHEIKLKSVSSYNTEFEKV